MDRTATSGSATGARVLLVEDDLDAIIIYSATLRHWGFKVRSAARLGAADAIAARWTPDVVVLDARLQDGAGLDLLARWRTVRGWTFPVVMLTGFPEETLQVAARRAGIDAFITKPCTGPALVQSLVDVLGRRRVAHASHVRPKAPPSGLSLVLAERQRRRG